VPAELRPALMRSAREIGQSMRDEARRAERDAIRQMQARGLTVVELTAAERAQWHKDARIAYPKLRGDYCPAQLYDEVMRLHDAFSASAR
jgi:TRAP-type C4-dicarboxylate transport system substrate-binding protein